MKEGGNASPTSVVIVLCNAPDSKTAHAIAEVLINQNLAACVNILPICHSVYRWEGNVVRDEEVPLFIKTTFACLAQVTDTIQVHHPYEVPEVIVIPIVGGSTDYITWVINQCH